MDLNEGYAKQLAEIIVFPQNKNANQVWFFRKNHLALNLNEIDKKKYFKKASQLLNSVMTTPDSINECITLEEIKKEMLGKNISPPGWMPKPEVYRPADFEMPLEMN